MPTTHETTSPEDIQAQAAFKFQRQIFTPKDCVGSDSAQKVPDEHADVLRETNDWISNYITKQVDKQGRREAICPFVEPSMKKKALFYSIANPEETNSIDALDHELRHYAEIFHALEPKHMPEALVKSVVAIFPDTRGPLLLEATDPSRDLKGDLLEKGILVGEFFSTCPFATTFNPKLFALRSPHPMYVLRSFIDTDWRFIAQVDRWKEIYRKCFGNPPEGLAHIGSFRGRVSEKLRSISARLGVPMKRKRR